VAGLG